MSTRKILLICKQCSQSFSKDKKEFDRQMKNGRQIDNWFCGRRCLMTHKNKNRSSDTQRKISVKTSIRNIGNSYAKKGNFTYYLNKARNRKHESDLTEEYLQKLWDEQKGKCVYSNIEMNLYNGESKLPTTASLDRIDSSLGYTKGNVQFVCFSLNLAKNNFDNDVFVNFLLKMSSKM